MVGTAHPTLLLLNFVLIYHGGTIALKVEMKQVFNPSHHLDDTWAMRGS